jgi:hypothetical protein
MRHRKTIKLEIHTDNDAFQAHEGGEVARIMRTLARSLSQYAELPTTARELAHGGNVREIDGNTCGSLTIEKTD